LKVNLLKKIGIIGFGTMGSIIAQKLASQEVEFEVFVFDKDKGKTENALGLKVADNIGDLALAVETIILAVKPQDFDHVLKELKNKVSKKLIISIAAGIPTRHIEKILNDVHTVRVMPNIGAKIEESVSCLSKGAFATDEDLEFTQELFYYLGVTRIIDESLMNAATAISGSGPAYIFDFIENNNIDYKNMPEHAWHDMMRRLEKAAENLGFAKEDAAFLAANTTNTSISLLKKTKLPPQELRKQVTSKGGTTEAALVILHKGGSWDEAAQAALRRAEELTKGL